MADNSDCNISLEPTRGCVSHDGTVGSLNDAVNNMAAVRGELCSFVEQIDNRECITCSYVPFSKDPAKGANASCNYLFDLRDVLCVLIKSVNALKELTQSIVGVSDRIGLIDHSRTIWDAMEEIQNGLTDTPVASNEFKFIRGIKYSGVDGSQPADPLDKIGRLMRLQFTNNTNCCRVYSFRATINVCGVPLVGEYNDADLGAAARATVDGVVVDEYFNFNRNAVSVPAGYTGPLDWSNRNDVFLTAKVPAGGSLIIEMSPYVRFYSTNYSGAGATSVPTPFWTFGEAYYSLPRLVSVPCAEYDDPNYKEFIDNRVFV